VQRGNVTGAITLLERAAGRLAATDRPAPHRIDADGLTGYAQTLVEDLRARVEVTPSRLRPRLVVSGADPPRHMKLLTYLDMSECEFKVGARRLTEAEVGVNCDTDQWPPRPMRGRS